MKRTWAVRPNPETGIVDREAMRESFMDAEAVLAIAGGVLSAVVQRKPTGVPGEMVTTFAIFEWKDRTDAKPQPEVSAPLVDEADVLQPDPDPTPAELEERLEAEAASSEPDGFDRSKLEEEDLSEIPAEMR